MGLVASRFPSPPPLSDCQCRSAAAARPDLRCTGVVPWNPHRHPSVDIHNPTARRPPASDLDVVSPSSTTRVPSPALCSSDPIVGKPLLILRLLSARTQTLDAANWKRGVLRPGCTAPNPSTLSATSIVLVSYRQVHSTLASPISVCVPREPLTLSLKRFLPLYAKPRLAKSL